MTSEEIWTFRHQEPWLPEQTLSYEDHKLLIADNEDHAL
jgi:hypothetical protein